MRLWDSMLIAGGALRASPLRSLLTMLGIIIGVAAVITMIAIGQGAHVQVVEQIRSLGTNLLAVEPGAASEGAVRLAQGTRHTLTETDAAAILQDITAVEVAAPAVRGTARVVQGNRNWQTRINGTTPSYFVAREWPLAAGRLFNEREVESAAKVALLGTTVAQSLFDDADPIGSTIRIGDVPFVAVGVLAAKGSFASGQDQDNIIFLPISTAKLRLLGAARRVNRNAVDYILVKVSSADLMPTAKMQIGALLRQRHRLPVGAKDDFQVHDPAAAMVVHQEATRTYTMLLGAIASISLLVGGSSIMNIMLVAAAERTTEIGIRLAVGACRRDIRAQFLVEAVMLCLLGGLIGIALGIGAAAAIAKLAGWPMFVGPGAIGLAFASAGGVGLFFGIYPAIKAARLDPIEALRFG